MASARLRSFLAAAALAIPVLLASGCGSQSPTAPTVNVPFSTTDLRVGTGTEAVTGRMLTVNYTGWIYDPSRAENKGTQFDTSAGRGPLVFLLGAGNLIQGWNMGIAGMKVGGLRRIVVPPALGYGAAGAGGGTVPPNATLLFEVELLDVQ
ncbi:MAG: FKBP-type peptidyl-prolyl cis-trans isomerase [Vicinamibacterales bacterium]